MIRGEPPTYDVATLERRARELLHAQFGADVPIPVDVDLLLETIEGVDLDIWPGLRSRYNVDGFVGRDIETGQLVILIDDWLADHRPTRYRMTVAEELGHVVLHRSLIEQVGAPDDFLHLQRHHRWHEMDRNAKRLAAAVLMPAKQIEQAAGQWYSKLVAVAGFEDVAAVKKHLAAQLAKQFEVSAQAMNIRLTEWPMRVFGRVEQAMKDRLDYL